MKNVHYVQAEFWVLTALSTEEMQPEQEQSFNISTPEHFLNRNTVQNTVLLYYEWRPVDNKWLVLGPHPD